jgi:hypothetical protein
MATSKQFNGCSKTKKSPPLAGEIGPNEATAVAAGSCSCWLLVPRNDVVFSSNKKAITE